MEPLLSAFGVNWKLLLAQGINFALLLAILSYFLYKPVLRMIDERREKIAEGVRAEEKGAEIVKSAEARAEGVLTDAATRAEEAKRQAMKESEKEITRAAMLAPEKIHRGQS